MFFIQFSEITDDDCGCYIIHPYIKSIDKQTWYLVRALSVFGRTGVSHVQPLSHRVCPIITTGERRREKVVKNFGEMFDDQSFHREVRIDRENEQ